MSLLQRHRCSFLCDLSTSQSAEEHSARVKAEGEAEDYSRRLTVAQEQIAEYALERHSEIAQLLVRAEQLGSALQQCGTAGSTDPPHFSLVGQHAEVGCLIRAEHLRHEVYGIVAAPMPTAWTFWPDIRLVA